MGGGGTRRGISATTVDPGPAGLVAPPHLQTLVRAWKQWIAHKPEAALLYQPTPTQLGIFLREEAKRGPTVAPSRLRSFRWLRDRIGLPFCIDAITAQGFVHAPVDQARALQPGDFWNMVALILQRRPKHTVARSW